MMILTPSLTFAVVDIHHSPPLREKVSISYCNWLSFLYLLKDPTVGACIKQISDTSSVTQSLAFKDLQAGLSSGLPVFSEFTYHDQVVLESAVVAPTICIGSILGRHFFPVCIRV